MPKPAKGPALTYSERWNDCWSRQENQTWFPDEQVVRFLARYVARRVGIQKGEIEYSGADRPAGLDLGCGKGRHVVLMSELGIETFGSDVSSTGIEFAKQWVKSRKLSASLECGTMERLSYPDDWFDFVICHGVLDHALKAVRDAARAEVARVLKPGGLFFFSVISEEDSGFGKGKPIEENTWLVDEGFESGIPQAFFSLKRLQSEFSNFQLESVVRCDCETVAGRSLIGTDKHYAVDSRWYATARRKA